MNILNCLIRDKDRVVSIAGAGGKTSLMFLLAHAFKKKGLTVVSTTTTHIFPPDPSQSDDLVFFSGHDDIQRLEKSIDQHKHVTVALKYLPAKKKLKGVSLDHIKQISNQDFIDRIIIEADGARMLSLKTPGENEPVVSRISDVFVSMVGLDSIGKSLKDETVFRAGLAAERAEQKLGTEITPKTVARLAVHEKGLLKACPQSARSYIFLNKTDIPGGREKALAVIEAAGKLTGRKPDFWIAGSIRQDFAQVTKGF